MLHDVDLLGWGLPLHRARTPEADVDDHTVAVQNCTVPSTGFPCGM